MRVLGPAAGQKARPGHRSPHTLRLHRPLKMLRLWKARCPALLLGSKTCLRNLLCRSHIRWSAQNDDTAVGWQAGPAPAPGAFTSGGLPEGMLRAPNFAFDPMAAWCTQQQVAQAQLPPQQLPPFLGRLLGPPGGGGACAACCWVHQAAMGSKAEIGALSIPSLPISCMCNCSSSSMTEGHPPESFLRSVLKLRQSQPIQTSAPLCMADF